MQRTLQEHIASLQQKIQTLRAQQDDPDNTADERYQLATDLRFAERALEHSQAAYELEQKISAMKVRPDGRGVSISSA